MLLSYIRVTIQILSPWRVGAPGEDRSRQATLTDLAGNPVIPASSLAGSFDEEEEDSYDPCDRSGPGDAADKDPCRETGKDKCGEEGGTCLATSLEPCFLFFDGDGGPGVADGGGCGSCHEGSFRLNVISDYHKVISI